MLILTREKDESIVITSAEDRIEITILRTKGEKVRLGITAPKRVKVHRKEIQLRIDKKKGATNGVVANLPS